MTLPGAEEVAVHDQLTSHRRPPHAPPSTIARQMSGGTRTAAYEYVQPSDDTDQRTPTQDQSEKVTTTTVLTSPDDQPIPTASTSTQPSTAVDENDAVPPDYDVSQMSVVEVGRCLESLQMPDALVDTFRQNLVDGKLMTVLDVDVIVTDFNCRKVDAIKLIQFFQKGWRPNYK